jgi:hypothetical protein
VPTSQATAAACAGKVWDASGKSRPQYHGLDMPTIALSVLLGACVLASEPQPLRLVVDPGAPPGPRVFASIESAINAARVEGPGISRIDLEIRPGAYEVRTGLHIGKNAAPLRIHASGPGVRLIGGAVIRAQPMQLQEGDAIRSRLPEAAAANVRWIDLRAATTGGGELSGPARHGMNLPAASGSELCMNGVPLTIARWPNQGFAPIEGVVDPGTSKDRPDSGEPRGGTFQVADRDQLARWASAQDVWLSGYWRWDWADDQLPAGKIDAAAGTITLGVPHTYGLAKGARFAVLNIPEELDAPGEYWIDLPGARAYFWPPEGAGDGPSEFIVSLLNEPMLTLDAAADVELAGLTFESGRGVAIRAIGVTNVQIDRCEFRNTGTGAIELDGRNCDVTACTFTDIGATGASLTGGDRAMLVHAENRVQDCTFRRTGRTHRTYQPAIRLDGVGQTIANNRIEDLPHSAIIFAGNEHVIELNDISRVLLETGDCGAIYCGRDWTLHGTVIRHNLFHDLTGTDARYQNAVYLDDMASGITVEGNIFVRCHWGMLVGGGRDIQIRGNLFDSCAKGLSFDNRGVGWMAKSIADPANSTLHQRYRAVPIDREPWSTRYPTLGAYLTDRFGRPTNGVIAGNMLFATPFGTVADRECVKVEGNAERRESLPNADRLVDPTLRRGLPGLIPDQAPEGFAPIPVSRIGPRS